MQQTRSFVPIERMSDSAASSSTTPTTEGNSIITPSSGLASRQAVRRHDRDKKKASSAVVHPPWIGCLRLLSKSSHHSEKPFVLHPRSDQGGESISPVSMAEFCIQRTEGHAEKFAPSMVTTSLRSSVTLSIFSYSICFTKKEGGNAVSPRWPACSPDKEQCGASPQPNCETISSNISRPVIRRTARLVWVWLFSCFSLRFAVRKALRKGRRNHHMRT